MRYRYKFKLIGFGKYEEVKEEIKEPRPVGFYWVRYKDSDGWTIAEWYGDYWKVLYNDEFLQDSDFDRIVEDRIKEPNN